MDKEKEIEELTEYIDKFSKPERRCRDGGDGLHVGLEYFYYQPTSRDVAEKLHDMSYRKADEVKKETAKEILDLLIRYDDGDSNSEAIKLIIDHYGLQEYIEVDE